eukprot:NODE_7821_length_741_cov_37.478964_g7570_i0.p1 GENE.NODE_7821_length_741_cov_37.478964_g7570_i0~~NODE_7821_length_741_cov_37.478964_g7570_i0.p1  ORF type:complete len:185 (+),score=32.64 NODE_7821_length_741_cov_37.478964_g7570_i0:94-648(+)
MASIQALDAKCFSALLKGLGCIIVPDGTDDDITRDFLAEECFASTSLSTEDRHLVIDEVEKVIYHVVGKDLSDDQTSEYLTDEIRLSKDHLKAFMKWFSKFRDKAHVYMMQKNSMGPQFSSLKWHLCKSKHNDTQSVSAMLQCNQTNKGRVGELVFEMDSNMIASMCGAMKSIQEHLAVEAAAQ